MGVFKGYKKLINEISILAEKLEDGSLTKAEIDDFCELSRKLNERALILRYKSIEMEVYAAKHTDEKKPTIDGQSEDSLEEPQQTKNEVENNELVFNLEDEEEVAVQESSANDADSALFSFDFSDQEDEKVKENKEDVEQERDGYDAEAEDEKVQPDEKTIVTTEKATHISSDNNSVSFYERFTQVHDQSLLAVLSSQKIDSLKGAFGLNDRLQIINELFDGETQAFDAAIETLDNQESGESAKYKLNQIAAQHQWEPDNRVVESFVKMIERRYAE